MLVFADRYQDETAGLVLVDSAHPDQEDRWLAILPTPSPNDSEALVTLRKDMVDPNPDDPNFPEPMNWAETLAQVRAVKSLGNLPLAVLVHGPDSAHTQALWAGLPEALVLKLEQVWLDLHKELATLSSDSQLIVAKKSGHWIQNDEPKLVIDAILDQVEKARQK